MVDSISRKNAALLSFENEVEASNGKIALMSKDLADRRALVESKDDPFEIIKGVNSENERLKENLLLKSSEYDDAIARVQTLEDQLRRSKEQHANAKESLALAETSLKKHGAAVESKETLEQLQDIWGILGVDEESREKDLKDIQSSIEDTCARKLKEATAMKSEIEKEIGRFSNQLLSMQRALGVTIQDSRNEGEAKMLERLQQLRTQVASIETPYKYASARRENLCEATDHLVAALVLEVAR